MTPNGRQCTGWAGTVKGVSREWGDDDTGGTIGRSIVDWGNADAMGVAVDCDRG